MCTKIEKIKKGRKREKSGDAPSIDWLARWRAWPRWMTLYFPRVHPDYGLKSDHKSSWILYRYVPAGGTAGRGRKFHRAITREEQIGLERAGWAAGGHGRMKKTGKEEKRRTSGQPSRCWEGCYGGCPKIEFAGTRENAWLSTPVGEPCVIMHPITLSFSIFDSSPRWSALPLALVVSLLPQENKIPSTVSRERVFL